MGAGNHPGSHLQKIRRVIVYRQSQKVSGMPRVSRPEMRALKSPYPTQKRFETAEEFCLHLLNDFDAPLSAKVRAAIGLVRAQQPRVRSARPGVKAQREERAEDAARGAFEPPPLPKRPH